MAAAPASGALTFVDAGHGLSSIIAADGERRHLASDDLPLGTLDGSTWTEQHATIGVGDTLVSVSDGLLDHFDSPDDTAAAIVRSAVAATSAADLRELLVGQRASMERADRVAHASGPSGSSGSSRERSRATRRAGSRTVLASVRRKWCTPGGPMNRS